MKDIKPIPKCFLIELKFNDKVEIFGAKDNLERKVGRKKKIFNRSNKKF